MSLLGKILAVLNIAAAGAFLYLAIQDYGVRQAWSYAVLRYDVALNGLPVDKEDRDDKGQPRYLNMNENLARELTGKPDLVTQADALQDLRSNLLNKVEDTNIKGTKVDKFVQLLLPLAETAAEREQLIEYKSKPANQDYAKLAERFNAIFEKALQTRDREGKRAAIARIMVNLIGVLPTEEEKKQAPGDPTTDPSFRRTLNVVGSRELARALQHQARHLAVLAQDVAMGRDQERMQFAEQHQALLNTLIDRHLRYQEVSDQLADKKAQVATQAKRAQQQEDLVANVKREHDKAQAETAKQLARLGLQQQEVFNVLVRLRDANRINQEMELLVRKLEEESRARQR